MRYLFLVLTFVLIFPLLLTGCSRTPTTGDNDSTTPPKNPDDTTAPQYAETSDASADTVIPTLDAFDASKKTLSYTDIVRRMVDTRYLSVAPDGERSAEFTSYNRKSAYENGQYVNWNANGDGGSYIRKQGDGGYVVAEIDGPGYISRIWSATAGTGHIKIYIDGSNQPVVDTAFQNLFSGNTVPFTYDNLCYLNDARGYNCYVPITFSKSCRVVMYDDWGKYYIINYTTFSDEYTIPSFTGTFDAEAKAALDKVNSFFDDGLGTNPLGIEDAAFESVKVTSNTPYVKNIEGAGAISGILVRLPDDIGPNYSETVIQTLKNLKMSIYYDGDTTPSVELPLGDFFGSSYGLVASRTLLMGVRDDKTLYNYYYMPFSDGAKVEISANEGYDIELEVSVTFVRTENTTDQRFYALFNRGEYHADASRHPDYSFLHATGTGRFVGITLHLYKNSSETDPNSPPGQAWWGEGDEKFFIDGEKFPSWYGTGTEDFFGYAWCDPTVYTEAFHTQPYAHGGSKCQGNRVETRLFLNDNVPFYSEFDGYLEKYYSDEYVHYAFAVCFYLDKEGSVDMERYSFDDYTNYFELDGSAYINDLTEGEDMYIQGYTGATPTSQSMAARGALWSNDLQLFWQPTESGRTLELVLPAKSDGEYMLLASFTKAPDYGTFQCSVNGSKIGNPVDLYDTAVRIEYVIEIGKVTLKEGWNNTLSFSVTGKNTSSKNYYFGLDFVILIPTAEYNGLTNLDLSEYTPVPRLNTKQPPATSFVAELERYIGSSSATNGTFAEQNMSNYSGIWGRSAQLFWKAKQDSAVLTTSITSTSAGKFDMTLDYTTAPDYANVEIYVNAQKVGEYDGYSKSVAHATLQLGEVELKAGNNEIKFVVKGKNTASTGYYVGLDSLTFDIK
ncbi:MAG: DUF2961 domain-containing protein [Clostridia bacterium]|nr:DUF2961 domain-containing protein [Clostridia bacterium]